jgi:hypothetical protein
LHYNAKTLDRLFGKKYTEIRGIDDSQNKLSEKTHGV